MHSSCLSLEAEQAPRTGGVRASARRTWEGTPSWAVGDDAMLVERFRAGDEQAVREVVRRYSGPMTTVARSFLRDLHRADDAVQQALLQAWRASGNFDPTRPLGPWLFAITRRVCIDLLRVEARMPVPRPADAGAAGASDTAAAVERAWLSWEVRRAIDRLPEEERAIVRLAHLRGMSQTGIADRLGLPLGTVKSRMFRAHRRLANVLGHLAGAGPDLAPPV